VAVFFKFYIKRLSFSPYDKNNSKQKEQQQQQQQEQRSEKA
jgi:hypothetical protein